MRAVARWPVLLPSLLALALLAAVVPAWAHERAPVVPAGADDPAVTVGWPAEPATAAPPLSLEAPGGEGPPAALLALLALLAVGLGLGFAGPRRAVSITLAGLLALLVFETGLHSVHHLDQPEAAAACTIATVAPHLAAVDADSVAEVHALLPTAQAAIDGEPPELRALVTLWDEGRAPPTSLL